MTTDNEMPHTPATSGAEGNAEPPVERYYPAPEREEANGHELETEDELMGIDAMLEQRQADSGPPTARNLTPIPQPEYQAPMALQANRQPQEAYQQRGQQMREQLRTALREEPQIEAEGGITAPRRASQRPAQHQPREAVTRDRAGTNVVNQSRIDQNRGRSAEARRPRTPVNDTDTAANGRTIPRATARTGTTSMDDRARSMEARRNSGSVGRPHTEPRVNHHEVTETETEDNQELDRPTTLQRQHHPYDQSIAEHRRRLAQIDLSRPRPNARRSAGTDYSTSQEDTDTVERRLSGRGTYAETDIRKMPWRKMRRVLAKKDKEYELMEQLLQKRLNEAIEEYERRGKVTLRYQEEGDERRYIDEQYMSSDYTDAPSEYSTSQEDSDQYESRFAGDLLAHQRPDHRLWPRRKFRHAEKQLRKQARADGRPSKPHNRRSRSAFQPVKMVQAEQLRKDGKYRPNVEQAYRHLFKDHAEYKAGKELSRDLGVRLPGREIRIPWRRDAHRRSERNVYYTADEYSPPRRSSSGRDIHRVHRGNQARQRSTRSESARTSGNHRTDEVATATEYYSADSDVPREIEAKPIQEKRECERKGKDKSTGSKKEKSKSEKKKSKPTAAGDATCGDTSDSEHDDRGGKIELPPFKGMSWPAYKNIFLKVAQYHKWSDKKKATALYTAVREDEGRAILAEESIHWSYEKLMSHLEERYGKNRTWADVLPEARRLRRKPGQPLSQFYDEVLKLLGTARLSPAHHERLAFQTYLDGLNCSRVMLNEVLQHTLGETIDELHSACTKYEALHGLGCYEYAATAPVHMVGAADDQPQHMGTQTYSPAAAPYYQQNGLASQPAPAQEAYPGYAMAPVAPVQYSQPPIPTHQPIAGTPPFDSAPATGQIPQQPPNTGMVAAVYPQGGNSNYQVPYNSRPSGYRNFGNYQYRPPPPAYQQAQQYPATPQQGYRPPAPRYNNANPQYNNGSYNGQQAPFPRDRQYRPRQQTGGPQLVAPPPPPAQGPPVNLQEENEKLRQELQTQRQNHNRRFDAFDRRVRDLEHRPPPEADPNRAQARRRNDQGLPMGGQSQRQMMQQPPPPAAQYQPNHTDFVNALPYPGNGVYSRGGNNPGNANAPPAPAAGPPLQGQQPLNGTAPPAGGAATRQA